MWEPLGCCFCFTRKTGCLILGTLVLIWSIVNFLHCVHVMAAVDLGESVKEICAQKEYEFQGCDTVLLKAAIAGLVITVVISVVVLFFSSMFIHGIRKEIPCLMVPFIVIELIHTILLVICGVVVIGVLIYVEAWGLFFFMGILLGIAAFLKTYFVLVMRAHYIEVKQSLGQCHRKLEEAVIEPQMHFKPNITA